MTDDERTLPGLPDDAFQDREKIVVTPQLDGAVDLEDASSFLLADEVNTIYVDTSLSEESLESRVFNQSTAQLPHFCKILQEMRTPKVTSQCLSKHTKPRQHWIHGSLHSIAKAQDILVVLESKHTQIEVFAL